jgi:hypothetical protein
MYYNRGVRALVLTGAPNVHAKARAQKRHVACKHSHDARRHSNAKISKHRRPRLLLSVGFGASGHLRFCFPKFPDVCFGVIGCEWCDGTERRTSHNRPAPPRLGSQPWGTDYPLGVWVTCASSPRVGLLGPVLEPILQ